MPNVVEDDTNLAEESKANKQSPMETQETVSDMLKETPSSQESSKDSIQQDVSEQDQLVDLDRGDRQHPNGDKSLLHNKQNVPFTKEDNTPPLGDEGDDKIPKNEEKVDTLFSEKGQENDASSLKNNNTPSPEMTEQDDLPPSNSPSSIQPQGPSSPNDDQINQLLSQKEDDQTDDTPPPEKTTNNDTPPEMANPQDVQQSSPMDTSSADQSLKPLDDIKHSSKRDDQLPILNRSVTGPASM